MVKWIGIPSALIVAGFSTVAVYGPAVAQDGQVETAKPLTAPAAAVSAKAAPADLSGIAIAYNGKDAAPKTSAAALASARVIPGGAAAYGTNTKAASAIGSPRQARVTMSQARLAARNASLRPAVATSADVKPNMIFTAGKDAFVIKRILPIEGPIKYGEWHWDDEGVPNGPLVVTVDLDARVLSVFRGGYEIGAAAVLLGTKDHPTPTGIFPILTKERHNVSEKYDNAPMPWTLRLTWDGVAIHGGGEVENGYASHGCIGAPDGFVSKLFDIAKKGDKVIITRGKSIGMGEKII